MKPLKIVLPDRAERSLSSTDTSANLSVLHILCSVRKFLSMDVAFVSQFLNGRRVFRYVDATHVMESVKVGAADPLEETYCQRVVDGRLPSLIRDTATLAAAQSLHATAALPVGAHLSVPIHLTDGNIYGTFCCFSHCANTALDERDLAMMRAFADLAAKQIECELYARRQGEEIEQRIRSILIGNDLSLVYQPIYDLAKARVVGFEALSRFAATPVRTPDVWFNEAAAIGLGTRLEVKAIALALQSLRDLPDHVYLSINTSPETVLSDAMLSLLQDVPLHRIVLEITEHAATDRYRDIAAIIHPLRVRGLRIAVDDAGAGYASFRHILNLAPDLIKLDVSLTHNINADNSRRALAAAMIRFSQETSSEIVAEGVETKAELETLEELGVMKAQGYLFGRPSSLTSAASCAALPEASHN